MKRTSLYSLLILSPLLILGCVSSAGQRVGGSEYPATTPESVEVFYQNPEKPFIVIGFVNVDRGVPVTADQIERKFKTVAATMGANAVIIEKLPNNSFFNYAQGSGKAIRWK